MTSAEALTIASAALTDEMLRFSKIAYKYPKGQERVDKMIDALETLNALRDLILDNETKLS